jgi:hypothetical protein
MLHFYNNSLIFFNDVYFFEIKIFHVNMESGKKWMKPPTGPRVNNFNTPTFNVKYEPMREQWSSTKTCDNESSTVFLNYYNNIVSRTSQMPVSPDQWFSTSGQ